MDLHEGEMTMLKCKSAISGIPAGIVAVFLWMDVAVATDSMLQAS